MGPERRESDTGSTGGAQAPGSGGVADAPDGQPAEGDTAESVDVVDFDALHAALGDLAAPPAPPAAPSSPSSGESKGQSSAMYASVRPHVIPKAYSPSEDPNAPAVIVETDAIAPEPGGSPANKMTLPMPGALRFAGPPSSGRQRTMPMPPRGAVPSPSTPFASTPLAPVGSPLRGAAPQEGSAMAPRHPRRSPKPTLVLRRGPTRSQKLVVFLAMLVVVIAGGVAILGYYNPMGLDLGALWSSPSGARTAGAATTAAPAPSPPRAALATSTVAPAPTAAAPSASYAAPPSPAAATPAKRPARRSASPPAIAQ